MHTRARILYERIIYNNIYIYELVLSIDGTHGMYRTSLVALRIIYAKSINRNEEPGNRGTDPFNLR